MRVEMRGRRKEKSGTQKFKHVTQCFHVMPIIAVPALNDVPFGTFKNKKIFLVYYVFPPKTSLLERHFILQSQA
jgi:hypothetical protein